MITVKKIKSLKPRTMIRKCSAVFHEAARNEYDVDYIDELIPVLYSSKAKEVIDEENYKKLDKLVSQYKKRDISSILFEDLSQLLLTTLGAEPSDWDFKDEHGILVKDNRKILPHTLILDRLRSPFNVGSIFRTADSFGIDKIILVEGTADVNHPRCSRTAMGTLDTVDYQVMDEKEVVQYIIESKRPVFALELGGTEINQFMFPKDGIAILGSEEFGVSPSLLKLCDDSLGRVSISLSGSKGSINVSVATGIMLHSWFASEG